MSNNFVSYGNAEALIEGINSKKVGKSDLTDIFATGTTNTTGSIITANTYFYLENDLVKALSDIAVNETFVEHTNYEVSDGALNEGSSGSGGHILQGQAGTDMIQRSRMQFLDAQVTDDSTNGKSKIEVVKQLTKSQLDALGNNTDGIYETTDEEDEELIGSRHTIKDGSGTSFTNQPNLQFVDAKVTNDAQGQATKVQNFVDINFDDWQEVDDNDDTYYRVLGAPLADGTVEADIMTKLWENDSPTSAFAAQQITLNSNDYDFLLWVFRNYATENYGINVVVERGQNAYADMTWAESSVIKGRQRTASYVSDTTYSVSQGSQMGSQNNSALIPQVIYGIKKKITISLSAIAKNVLTDADHCMLDENTSVKDVVPTSSNWVDITSQCTFNSTYNHNLSVADNGREYLVTGSAKNMPAGSALLITFPKNFDLGKTDTNGYVTEVGDSGNGLLSSSMIARFSFRHNSNTLHGATTSGSGYYGVYIRIKHF